MAQKQRTKKVSKGIHGARKNPLSHAEKIAMGKGAYRALTPVQVDDAWYGATSFKQPFDAEQAKLNRVLYPHLFGANV